MGDLHDCSAIKFASCINLWSFNHTAHVIIWHPVWVIIIIIIACHLASLHIECLPGFSSEPIILLMILLELTIHCIKHELNISCS